MLEAGKALGRIVVLVVDVDIAVCNSFTHIFGQKALVHIGLCCLRGKLHHHTGRGVGIHIGILAGDIVGLRVNDALEDFPALRLAGEVALVAVGDILLRHLFARALHKLHLDAVLDFLNAHLFPAVVGNLVGDLGCEHYIFTFLGDCHCFQYGCNNLLVVELDCAAVSFNNAFYHCGQKIGPGRQAGRVRFECKDIPLAGCLCTFSGIKLLT